LKGEEWHPLPEVHKAIPACSNSDFDRDCDTSATQQKNPADFRRQGL